MALSQQLRREKQSRTKREYPDRPLVGVGGVVIHQNKVLLVRRKEKPLKGQWSIPGGLVEIGERLEQAVRRELKEETGLDITPLRAIAVVDRVVRRGKRVQYHYVIVDYACRMRRGRLAAASDVLEARWVRRQELPRYRLNAKALTVVLQGFRFFERAGKKPRGYAQFGVAG